MMQVDEATAKSLQSDMVLLDKYITDLRELNGKIAAQSAKISSGGRSLLEWIDWLSVRCRFESAWQQKPDHFDFPPQ